MITRKQYESEAIKTWDIFNNKEYRKWLLKKSSSFQKWLISPIHLLSKDNRKTFKQLFGRASWRYDGEFHFSVWVREFKNEIFLLLTAKEKGTCIEMVGNYDNNIKRTKTILAFTKDLYSRIKEIKRG